MGSDNPNHNDAAASLHAEILRRTARDHRRHTRDYIVIFANRGMPPGRISDILDVDPETVARALAVDGRRSCAECVYGRHSNCDQYHYRDALYIVPCECSCHTTTDPDEHPRRTPLLR